MIKVTSIFVGILLLIFSNKAISQTESGYVLIGGGSQLSLTSQKTSFESKLEDPKNTTTIDFTPYFGFFISNNVVLGAVIPLKMVTEKVKSTKEKSNSAAIGPFIRYYANKEENIRPYLQGMVGFGHMIKPGIISYGMFLYEFDAGLGYFINEKVCLDIQMGYCSIKYDVRTSSDLNNAEVFFTKSLGINLGLVLLL